MKAPEVCPCCGQRIKRRQVHGPLHQARLDAGLKIREVAAKTDLSLSYISALETGKANEPSLRVVRKLTRLYDKTADELWPEEAS